MNGTQLKSIRKERGLSLRDLQAMTGVSASTLSRFENNKGWIAYENLKRVIDALGIHDSQVVTSESVFEQRVQDAIKRRDFSQALKLIAEELE